MVVERPPQARVEAFGGWLADVVEDGAPAQPEVVCLAAELVEHNQGVREIVLVADAFLGLNAFQRTEFRENQREQAAFVQEFEANRGPGRGDDLVELIDDALFRDDVDALAVADNRVEGFGGDEEAQLGGETDGAHHAERVVAEGDVGVERRTDRQFLHVVEPAERIDQLSESGFVQAERQGVDGEIASVLVVFQSPVFHDGLPAVVAV